MKSFYLIKVVKIFAIFIFAILCLRTFIIEPGVVNGLSMDETFIDDEYFIINKFSLLFREPKRGEVVQFFNKNNDEMTIKRVIGLPGEKVFIKKNSVYIITKKGDEKKLSEPYLNQYTITRPSEEFGDKLYSTILDHEYFVLGDNRKKSTDSRHDGAVHRKDIRGLVVKLPFSKK